MSLIVDEHRLYLSDPVRLDAFRRAIEEVVRPGHVVLDLGAGTGILGLMACRAGAGRVYCVDAGGILEIARKNYEANGYGDRAVFLKGLSTRLELPEPVDVVVADQMGRFGFEPGIVEYFEDAQRRFLRPGGTLIPGRIDLHVFPVEHQGARDKVDFWRGTPAGFDMLAVREWAANTGYPAQFSAGDLLAQPAIVAAIELGRTPPRPLTLQAEFVALRSGTLHGIGGHFTAQLSAGSVLTNSPLETAIQRAQVFFPIDEPVRVDAGTRIAVSLWIHSAEVMVTWRVNVEVPGATSPMRTFVHSTLRGMLVARESLDKMKPTFRPRLTKWGEARRTVLELCNAERSLVEIEQAVFAKHADILGSEAAAQAFVAEVVGPYAQ